MDILSAMRSLNSNHLFYFRVVARAGGVVRAGEELMVSRPTIGARLKELDAALGRKLFVCVGRGLAPTAGAEPVWQCLLWRWA